MALLVEQRTLSGCVDISCFTLRSRPSLWPVSVFTSRLGSFSNNVPHLCLVAPPSPSAEQCSLSRLCRPMSGVPAVSTSVSVFHHPTFCVCVASRPSNSPDLSRLSALAMPDSSCWVIISLRGNSSVVCMWLLNAGMQVDHVSTFLLCNIYIERDINPGNVVQILKITKPITSKNLKLFFPPSDQKHIGSLICYIFPMVSCHL